MRLSADQVAVIRKAAARTLGPNATVRLFGSRLNDNAKGGDIDLHVELDAEPADLLDRELKFYVALQRDLGERRIDIVTYRRGATPRPIDREALSNGVPL